MSGAQGPVQILSTLVNGSFEWTFGQDAVWAGDAGDFVLRASALGSGAVGAYSSTAGTFICAEIALALSANSISLHITKGSQNGMERNH